MSKVAALKRRQRLFEARRLLEEVRKESNWVVYGSRMLENFYHIFRRLCVLTLEFEVLSRLSYLDGILCVTLMSLYFPDSAHDFLPINFPMKKKAWKIPF